MHHLLPSTPYPHHSTATEVQQCKQQRLHAIFNIRIFLESRLGYKECGYAHFRPSKTQVCCDDETGRQHNQHNVLHPYTKTTGRFDTRSRCSPARKRKAAKTLFRSPHSLHVPPSWCVTTGRWSYLIDGKGGWEAARTAVRTIIIILLRAEVDMDFQAKRRRTLHLHPFTSKLSCMRNKDTL